MSEKTKQNQNRSVKFILLVLGAAVGMALLILGGRADGEAAEAVQSSGASDTLDAEAYADMLEERVADICSRVAGAGKTEVFVSLKGGYRTVYAVDSQANSSGYKSEVVMSGSGADKKAVVTAYENPEIGGVAIVCEGAGNSAVRTQIISLVSAALGIGTNKIYVAAS